MNIINFRKVESVSKYLDPMNDFQIKEVKSEKRYDPLTGQMVRLFPSRKMAMPRHDWTPFVEESRKRFCPFCPEVMDKVTPRFPGDFIPEGRLTVGDSVLIPNLNPYEVHSSVVVMTPVHYLSMPDITPEVVTDSMEAGLRYLQIIAEKDPVNSRCSSIGWNYMPYSGGSLIHPHLQIISGSETCNLDGQCFKSAADYYGKTGRIFWHDLLEAERGGERYAGSTGNIEWMTTFAPLGMADVTAVIKGGSTVFDMTRELLSELARGMKKVITFYDSVNISAFNMSLNFAGKGEKGYCCNARMVGRYTLFPLVGSDISHMQMLHQDPWSLHSPEEMAVDLRPHF